METPSSPAAGAPTKSVRWEGLIAPLDVETIDHRLIVRTPGELRTRDLPLPLLYRPASELGHENLALAGLITRISVESLEGWHGGYGLFAEGMADDGTELAQRLRDGERPCCGVDLDQVVIEERVALDGEPLFAAVAWRVISVTVNAAAGVSSFPDAHIRLMAAKQADVIAHY